MQSFNILRAPFIFIFNVTLKLCVSKVMDLVSSAVVQTQVCDNSMFQTLPLHFSVFTTGLPNSFSSPGA